ncbi:hypothetical protein C3387_04970 [Leclercia sp. LSNIH6]|nr:hypothetical protein C3370_13400 [Leclercia sp. LSNIH7]POU78857.1 hypothetical protein C3387_04970 [Leclercia sp. LSNIH6]POW53828.1 hypothetical protein C3406_00830 [Leclercia sp. LSNIH8]
MVRPSKVEFDVEDILNKDKFSAIPLARRKEIEQEVQQEYVARLNAVKAQVEILMPQQREEFHHMLTNLLAQISFTRNINERK